MMWGKLDESGAWWSGSVQSGSLLVSELSGESLSGFLTPHKAVRLNSPRKDGGSRQKSLWGDGKKSFFLPSSMVFRDQLSLAPFRVCCQILAVLPQSPAVCISPLRCGCFLSSSVFIAVCLSHCSSLPAGLMTFLFLIIHMTTQFNFLNVSWLFRFPHQILFHGSSLAKGEQKVQMSFLGVQRSPYCFPVALSFMSLAVSPQSYTLSMYLYFLPHVVVHSALSASLSVHPSIPLIIHSLGPQPALPGCFCF